MMCMKKWLGVLLGSVVCISSSVLALEDPITKVRGITSAILSELGSQGLQLPAEQKREFIYQLVDRLAVPHFALEDMAKAVVGRGAWEQADITVREDFIQEFKSYVINTYTAALGSYDGKQQLVFLPVRGEYTDKVVVTSQLELNNGTAVQIQYSLMKRGANWLVYDLKVDGVSLVKNYNAQFASTLRTQGLRGLVEQIRLRNAK